MCHTDTRPLCLQGTVFRYPRPQLQERLLQLTLTAPPLLLRKMPTQQHALYHITYLARQLALQPLEDPDKMEACAAVPDINALLRSAEAAGENVGPATRTMIGALSLMRSCGINHAWVGAWGCRGAVAAACSCTVMHCRLVLQRLAWQSACGVHMLFMHSANHQQISLCCKTGCPEQERHAHVAPCWSSGMVADERRRDAKHDEAVASAVVMTGVTLLV